ncbi:hypothetical protein M9Y10_031855 [Tritrichomonas musculus]|uniref:Uncharacterized protein n=1 Tax=Tritrichomonas musculus TaxID=1915356 RepID=A0ABR2GZX7_9EUKA
MKIEMCNIEDHTVANIYVDQSSDYVVLNKILNKGDMIETKIRRKDKSLKNPVFYAIVKILIDQIEYTTEPEDAIHIVGKVMSSDNENVKENSKQSLWITDGCELKLFKEKWEQKELNIIDEIIHPKPAEKKKNLTSPRDLQEKCFDILHKYLVKNYNMVVYGNETYDALENGAVKVLFVTEDFIERQNEKWKSALSSDDHKYHGANIVVYDKGAINYDELTNFGGIIGVLKYNFASSENFEN